VAASRQEKIPGTHWIRGWVDLRAGLNAMKRRKIVPLLGIMKAIHFITKSK
jgi:hypothetical protein